MKIKTTVGVFIIDKIKQRILCTHPTLHHPLQWDIIKGVQEPNEPPIITLYREFEEETSQRLFIDIKGKLIDIPEITGKTYKYKHRNKQLYPYVFFVDNDCKVDLLKFKCNSFVDNNPNFPEIDAFSWIEIENYQVLHETQRTVLDDIMKIFSNVFGNTNISQNKSILDIKSELYG